MPAPPSSPDALADALVAHLLAAHPPSGSVARADVQRLPLPVARLLAYRLDARVAAEARTPDSAWFDGDAAEVRQARAALVRAARGAARFPAEAWEPALRAAVAHALGFLLYPAETAPLVLFEDAFATRPAGAVVDDLDVFGAYPYLGTIAARYVERRGLERLERTALGRLLRGIEERMAAGLSPADLAAAAAPLAALAGALPGLEGRLPTPIARHFLRARGRDDLARALEAPNVPPLLAPADFARALGADPSAVPGVRPPDVPAASISMLNIPALDAGRAASAQETGSEATDSEAAGSEAAGLSRGHGAEDFVPMLPPGAEWPAADRLPLVDQRPRAAEAGTNDRDPAEASPAEAGESETDASWVDAAETKASASTESAPNPRGWFGDVATPPAGEQVEDDPAEVYVPEAHVPEAHVPEAHVPDVLLHETLLSPLASPPAPAAPDDGSDDRLDAWAHALPGASEADPSSTADAGEPAAGDEPLWQRLARQRQAAPPPAATVVGEAPLWMRFAAPEAAGRHAPPADAPAAAPRARDEGVHGASDPDAARAEARVLGSGAAGRREWYVAELFGGDAEAYYATLARLDAAPDWTAATAVLGDFFRTHRVSIYSDAAVSFTDDVQGRYAGQTR